MFGISPTRARDGMSPTEYFSLVQSILNPELFNKPELTVGLPEVGDSRMVA
jgi:hypothetical protein